MMKQETEIFISKVEKTFSEGSIDIRVFDNLMTEWGLIISDSYYERENQRQTYLNLNQLRLKVQWFIQQETNSKKEQFCVFMRCLICYVDVELQSLKEHSEVLEKTTDISGTQSNKISWTTSKRSLIELICALHEAKCINDGNSTLQKTVVLFEEVFSIKLDNYHSEVNRMALRKPIANSDKRAYFLNKLSEGFNNKMLDK